MTGYAAGMRVSEIIHLKIADIDSIRMMIHIYAGKERRTGWFRYRKSCWKPCGRIILFTNPKNTFSRTRRAGFISVRSAQQILHNGKQEAGIQKKESIHMLRHSYATHLMESGTDIRIIQELLGHNCIKTTMRCTHVSKKDIGRIGSPLDRLNW